MPIMKKKRYSRGVLLSFFDKRIRKGRRLGRDYLAFGGGVTYTKKSQMSDMEELLRYVPEDRLLLETDSPYLAPVPLRGSVNTPLNIRYVYEFISTRRGITMQQLNRIVEKNCEKLFKL